jgi:hypothetical protein
MRKSNGKCWKSIFRPIPRPNLPTDYARTVCKNFIRNTAADKKAAALAQAKIVGEWIESTETKEMRSKSKAAKFPPVLRLAWKLAFTKSSDTAS